MQKLKKYLISSIHQVIRRTSSLSEAATQLQVTPQALKTHLKKFPILDENGLEVPLTYDILMNLEESVARERLKPEFYDASMGRQTREDLDNKTLAEIHQIIIDTASLRKAAAQLGKTAAHFGKYLFEFTVPDDNGLEVPLYYSELKKLTPAMAKEKWGAEIYDAPKQKKKQKQRVDLTKMTLAEIHQVILETDMVTEAASRLGVKEPTFEAYLGKAIPDKNSQASSLTYDDLKALPKHVAQEKWGVAYNAPMQVRKADFTEKTLAEIHQVIRKSTSLTKAANMLGMLGPAFEANLYKFRILNESGEEVPATYNDLKCIDENTARDKWGSELYDAVMQKRKINFAKTTLAEIHQAIIETNTAENAAKCLYTTAKTLKIRLGKCTVPGMQDRLTYEYLKGLRRDAAIELWGEQDYDAPLQAEKLNFTEMTFAFVHQAIRKHKSITDTANNLGMRVAAFKAFLGGCKIPDKEGQVLQLDYDHLKTLDPDSARAIWGDEIYNGAMKKRWIDLTKKTFAEIHQAIRQTDSLANAAGYLGVMMNTLRIHLAKSVISDENGQDIYEYLKGLEASVAIERFGAEYYNAPMEIKTVRLDQKSFAEIHQAIRLSDSLTGAANILGTIMEMLSFYLAHCEIVDESGQAVLLGLTYNDLKNLEVDAAREKWGDEIYNAPMQIRKVDLAEKTLSEIHQAIMSHPLLMEAAHCLGVYAWELQKHLTDCSMTYDYLKKHNEEVVRAQWGNEFYHASLGPKPIGNKGASNSEGRGRKRRCGLFDSSLPYKQQKAIDSVGAEEIAAINPSQDRGVSKEAMPYEVSLMDALSTELERNIYSEEELYVDELVWRPSSPR